ncbi:MAG: hypothetical protein WD225_09380 [Ilumatobacteraceae bacterium]
MASSLPALDRYRGRWVALDQDEPVVVAVADSHEALLHELEHGVARKVVIQRVPTMDEPLFIGLD